MNNIDKDNYIWIPMKRYCKLKNISRKTCWLQRKQKKIKFKKDNNKIFIAIEKNSCFINNKNEFYIFDDKNSINK